MQKIQCLLLQWRQLFFRVGEHAKRALCCDKITVADLQTCLPEKGIGNEWERVRSSLQAHKECRERSLYFGHLSANMQQQKPQKLYFHARIFFSVGEIASVAI